MRPAIPLPEAAREKLLALQLARDAALDAAHGATGRLNQLGRDVDQRMRERLVAEQTRHQQTHAQLAGLLSRLNQWLMELPRGVTLEPAPTLKLELKDGETLNEALTNARAEIAQLHQQLQSVKTAPLPLADQRELAKIYVAGLMRRARPRVAFVKDQLRVSWLNDVIGGHEDLLATLAWLMPDTLLSALEREIIAAPADRQGISPPDRMRKIAEIEAALDGFERAEQALIERAAADGITVPQRGNVSPAAFLHVTVVKAQQTEAAA